MKVLYIYRNPKMGISIGKVFHTIEKEMNNYCEVDSIYLPESNYNIQSLYQNIRFTLRYLKDKHYDIIHITGTEHYLLPFLKRENTIITVHDIGFYTQIKKGLKAFGKYMLWIRTLKYAKHITFISEFSRQETLNLIKVHSDKCSVIHNPIDKEFQFHEKPFNAECPRILHIGTKANKNLTNTIKALEGFPCTLRIIGKLSDKEERLLKDNSIHYSNVYNLSDKEIIEEYQNCDIVNFPSLYEGFGMPILEGQSIGRVVVTSNIPPMNQIVGKGAILVNPNDIESIRRGYRTAIKEHEQYIKKGIENAKYFSSEEIVKAYWKLYQHCY